MMDKEKRVWRVIYRKSYLAYTKTKNEAIIECMKENGYINKGDIIKVVKF